MTPPRDLADYWTPAEIARTLWAMQYIAEVFELSYGPASLRIQEN